VAGVIALWLWKQLSIRDLWKLTVGFSVPVLTLLCILAFGGALRPFYDATVVYNLQYSGETYAGPFDMVRYLLTFPVERARNDALWTLGGAGCLLLIAGSLGSRDRLIPVLWVAAACASIAINGSRGLPQYFVQANPALALAAGWGGAMAWGWLKASVGGAPGLSESPPLSSSRSRSGGSTSSQSWSSRHSSTPATRWGMPREVYLERYADDRNAQRSRRPAWRVLPRS
jgi:hypothetical protein